MPFYALLDSNVALTVLRHYRMNSHRNQSRKLEWTIISLLKHDRRSPIKTQFLNNSYYYLDKAVDENWIDIPEDSVR